MECHVKRKIPRKADASDESADSNNEGLTLEWNVGIIVSWDFLGTSKRPYYFSLEVVRIKSEAVDFWLVGCSARISARASNIHAAATS